MGPVSSLVNAPGGWMIVQVVAADRPVITRPDLLGRVEERAAAYSTCVAYCGRYEVRGGQIVHHVEMSLFRTGSARSRGATGN
ncbi:MAG: lipocalin-like domain-containing protein [Pseudonocardiaceae bacterium]